MSTLSDIGTKIGNAFKSDRVRLDSLESDESLIRQLKVMSSPLSNLALATVQCTTVNNTDYTGSELILTPNDSNSWFRINY